MNIRLALCSIGLSLATATATPVLAASECLADGKSFQIGQISCLTLAGQSHLARCDMVLNNTSWTKIQDDCPEPAPHPHNTPIPTPAPSLVPTEPTEN